MISITHKKVDDNLDRIIKYLSTDGTSHLSEKNKDRLDKIDFVDTLYRNGRAPKQIVLFLQKRYPKDKISRATAYRYIADAKYVYGSMNMFDKEYYRGVAIDMILDTRQRARKSGDTKTMSSCDRNFITVLNLDKEDVDLPPLDRIQPPVQVIHIENTFIDKYAGILPADIVKQAKTLQIEAKPDADQGN